MTLKRKHFHLTSLAWLAIVGSAAGSAAAQEDPAGSVLITGSARAQRGADAPFAISAVTAEELRTAGPMINLSEALVRVPGLVVNNRNNYAQDLQISSRGFGARAAFGVRGLRLYADGIPATMPDGQGQVAHFDLAGAERIEVLRGPFSVLYGNSSGGVIALFGAPVKRPLVEAAIDAGSFGLSQERLKIATPLGAGFDLQATGSNVELEGFRPQSAAHRQLGNLRLHWQAWPADEVTFQLSDHNQRAQDPLGLTHAQFDADARQTTSVATQFDTRKTIRQTQGGLNWKHRFGDDSVLRETALTVYDGSRGVTQWQAIAPATQANARHGGGVVDFDRAYGGTEARATLRLGPADVVAGLNAETQRDERRGFENFIGTGAAQLLGATGKLRRDESNRAATREAFAQAQLELGGNLELTGGARGGRVEMRTSDHFLSNGDDSGALAFSYTNPALGLRWRLAPGWNIHASVARGFESPTLGELAYRPDGKAGFNTALTGQSSRQYELGSKWRSAAIDVDAVLFLADTANEIGVQTNASGRSTFQNVGHTRRDGLELAGTWRVAPSLRLQGNMTLLHAVYRDGFLTCTATPCAAATVPVAAGNRISGTQRASAFAEAAWRPGGWGELALEWQALARAAVNDTNSDYAAGHALANLRASGRWALGDGNALEWLARIDNLLDRKVVGSVIVNDANGRFFEPGAPRSLLLSLRWQHGW